MPLSEAALRSALERIGSDAPVRFDEVTGSTQATALDLARAGAPEWTLVAAGHQTEGRGRLGRIWLDEPGRALLFSLVLRPTLPPERGGLLSLLAGASMARALRETAGAQVGCTWPNDLMVGEGKVGGILAGSVLEAGGFAFVVLGVGVNLGAVPDVPGAGALEAEPDVVLEAFLQDLARAYEPSTAAFAPEVVASYRELCATLGRRVRARTTSGAIVEGEAVDIDEDGSLVIRAATGLETVRFGEVEHLGSGALPG